MERERKWKIEICKERLTRLLCGGNSLRDKECVAEEERCELKRRRKEEQMEAERLEEKDEYFSHQS